MIEVSNNFEVETNINSRTYIKSKSKTYTMHRLAVPDLNTNPATPAMHQVETAYVRQVISKVVVNNKLAR